MQRATKPVFTLIALMVLFSRLTFADALVAHWTMDRVTDGLVKDVSGHGHDAQIGGLEGTNPVVVPGVIGNALRFEAARQTYLTVAKCEDLTSLPHLTVMAWIKPADRSKAYEIVCNRGDRGGNPPWPGWRLRYGWSRVYFQYGTAEGKDVLLSSPEWSVPAGFWTHVAATFDGEMVRLFVNGVERASVAGEGNIAPRKSPLIIGNYIGRKDAYAFDGLMDDVKIFDHALTEAEIFAEAVRGME